MKIQNNIAYQPNFKSALHNDAVRIVKKAAKEIGDKALITKVANQIKYIETWDVGTYYESAIGINKKGQTRFFYVRNSDTPDIKVGEPVSLKDSKGLIDCFLNFNRENYLQLQKTAHSIPRKKSLLEKLFML